MTWQTQDQPASSPTALWTAGQVAEQLQISTRTLWRLRREGRVPAPVKVGAATRWRREDLVEWIRTGCPAVENLESKSLRTGSK